MSEEAKEPKEPINHPLNQPLIYLTSLLFKKKLKNLKLLKLV